MTVVYPPDLKVGDQSSLVLAAGRAYHKLLTKNAANLTTGFYGAGVVHDVSRARVMRHSSQAGGSTIEHNDWAQIWPCLDDYGHWLINHADTNALIRERLMLTCDRALRESWRWHYLEKRPMGSSMWSENTMDCSETVTLICKSTGIPDPNGRNYNGEGFTGTLMDHLPAIPYAKRKPGDLLFYDGPWHVAMVQRDLDRVLTFGSNPLCEKSATYRKIAAVRGMILR